MKISFLVLCEYTTSAETFLLASAALANLTFMEPSAVHAMQRHETVRVLVSTVLQHSKLNYHLQRQDLEICHLNRGNSKLLHNMYLFQ